MPTTRIKEKISTLVTSQLPEFIQSEYTTFIAFLEAYYEFLEQDQSPHEVIQNIRSYSDIDRSIDSFIQYFLNQYSAKIPRSVLYDKKALVKNITDLYDSKGGEKSYHLLFQILYNKKVDIRYPFNQVLKTSDGKWVQKTSFFMTTITGSGTTILNKNLFIKSATTFNPIVLSSRKVTSISTGRLTNTHEYFYDGSKNTPINVGDVIEYENFKGTVIGVPAVAEVVQAGSGFKVGDILPLVAGLGNGAKLKVTRVTATGGIRNVQFINYGTGYETDFYNFFTSGTSSTSISTFSYTGGVAAITDYTSGFVERGTITKQDYAVSYFAEDYQGVLLGQFYNSTVPTGALSPSISTSASTGGSGDAAIFIRIGSKTRYPGYYLTTDGFLSDNIYLEDQNYYQPFSYVIKVDEQLSNYKQAVLDLLHPAGTKLLGELALSVDIDSVTELTSFLRYLTSNFQDIFGIVDSGDAKDIIKIPSPDSVLTGEYIPIEVIKPREDNITTDDVLTRHLTRPLSNSTVITDTVFSANISSILTPIGFTATDSVISFINNLIYTDNIGVISDNGSVLITDYADPTYFAQDYVGTATTF